jgi:hypothetical protein
MPPTIHDKKLLQNKDEYRNMASFDSSRKMYAAVETAEHVYTDCAAKHWAEQSVCTIFFNFYGSFLSGNF